MVVPVEVLEDSEALLTWARRAIRAAQSKTVGVVRREHARGAKPAKKR